ncbi:MAG: glycoside hydrolase family 3 C-terminal domain-containing protein [Oscillospiraceae bacterium]|nr:glycoside hydrolase family 3 C-terminal domain-containing protein [Oscillospiraceae bacterium]
MNLLNYEREHLESLRPLLPECAVLLKSDGSFPLKQTGRLALYGNGARRTVKGGTGSGEVNSRFFVTAEEGLRKAGFEITSGAWLDAYDVVLNAAKKAFIGSMISEVKNPFRGIVESMGKVMPEPEYDLSLEAEGDAAVYVLARISGEGSDRRNVAGDIQLTRTEIRDILRLRNGFEKFLLVLNVGGPVDLSPLADEVQNILLLSQLGVETGAVLADLILGKACPSGKLSTSWAAFDDYPKMGDFGEKDDIRYREGIYFGYRYYDSAGVRPMFPFGFGLSYTSFEIGEGKAVLEGETVTVSAVIKNTGEHSGKETLQLYVSKPEKRLDQPFQTLAAFRKSNTLEAGEEENVCLSFRLSDLASYDSRRECYVLEKGDYFLRLGNSSAETEVLARIRLGEEIITRRTANRCGVTDFADWKPSLERIDMFPPGLPILEPVPDVFQREPAAAPEEEILPEVRKLTEKQLISLSVGAHAPKNERLKVVGDSAFSVAGAAGETSQIVKELGIPTLVMADGPAGLRLSRSYVQTEQGPISTEQTLPESVRDRLPKPLLWAADKLGKKAPKDGEILHQYATAIPIGTAIAQSWNPELAESCGDIVGDEMERMNIDLWLAPAMNLHRDIRCGRNFEYFSEDPLLSGIMAAAITRGVQSHPGRGVTVKHFAANNQEYNRFHSNSVVSERTMREMYLRGFEICIRESKPAALMTSYNLLNGVHTSEHEGLIRGILRDEFGFDGIIMTDWVIAALQNRHMRYPEADAGRVAAAGGELFMPGSETDEKNIRDALKRGYLTEDRLRRNVSHMLRRLLELKEAQRQ